MPTTTIRYADILNYLTAVMGNENVPISASPHGQWWSGLSYTQFTSQPVPNVAGGKINIMDTGTPLQSAFYLVLTDPNGYQGPGGTTVPQMPGAGPYITDQGYTATLPDNTTITGAQIAANIKSWLEGGFPE